MERQKAKRKVTYKKKVFKMLCISSTTLYRLRINDGLPTVKLDGGKKFYLTRKIF